MPPIGLLTSGVDFAKLEWVLKPEDAATKHAAVAIQYGAFINTLIQFVIIAATVFMLVKGANTVRRFTAREQEKAPPPAPTPTEVLLTEIRDLLNSEAGAAAAVHQNGSRAAKRS